MNKFVGVFLLASVAVASAQATNPQYTPVTIDGVTTQRGTVTVGGKTYVSLDALKAAGVNVLKSGSLGIYRYPVAQSRTVKLTGCTGEWLDNGRDRINLGQPVWNTAGEYWEIPFQMQVPDTNVYPLNRFESTQIAVVFASGRVVQYAKDPLGRVESGGFGTMTTGTNNPGSFAPRHPDLLSSDPPVKIVLPAAQGLEGANSRVISADLKCKK
ncbi:hypothetical protein [Deinococcus sp. PESE-13]